MALDPPEQPDSGRSGLGSQAGLLDEVEDLGHILGLRTPADELGQLVSSAPRVMNDSRSLRVIATQAAKAFGAWEGLAAALRAGG